MNIVAVTWNMRGRGGATHIPTLLAKSRELMGNDAFETVICLQEAGNLGESTSRQFESGGEEFRIVGTTGQDSGNNRCNTVIAHSPGLRRINRFTEFAGNRYAELIKLDGAAFGASARHEFWLMSMHAQSLGPALAAVTATRLWETFSSHEQAGRRPLAILGDMNCTPGELGTRQGAAVSSSGAATRGQRELDYMVVYPHGTGVSNVRCLGTDDVGNVSDHIAVFFTFTI